MKPVAVARIHREMCRRAGCATLDQIDYLAGCCQCPERHFPNYDCRENEEPPTSTAYLPIPLPPPVCKLPSPATWDELHRRALAHDDSDDSEWLTDFLNRVPNISCDCRRHAKEWVRDNPPRWSDYFAWTVDFHNAVNVRLGKPVLTFDQARALY
jgi:hypothetical protein